MEFKCVGQHVFLETLVVFLTQRPVCKVAATRIRRRENHYGLWRQRFYISHGRAQGQQHGCKTKRSAIWV